MIAIRSPSREAEQDRNGLVAELGAGVRGQHLDQMWYDVSSAQLLSATGLAGDGVQRSVAHQFDGVAQSQGEDRCRCFVGVVIEEVQATAAHERVGMVKRRELDLTDGGVGCDGRPPLGQRGREPLQEARGRLAITPDVPTRRVRRG
jgi:hypothetical protein